MTAIEILGTAFGEVIRGRGVGDIAEREPSMVMHRCGSDKSLLFCETHDTTFATRRLLDAHLQTTGPHRVAVHCGKHGWYEEWKAPAQFEGQLL